MYGDSNPISRLNAVENNDSNSEEGKNEDEELRLFTSTTFFDLDMGRSTDIATTVDELLMQQEKQLQYPHKQQPLDPEAANRPVAGPSRSDRYDMQQQIDFANLQRFSLAEELPPVNLSIYDVDPLFRQQAAQDPGPHPHGAALGHPSSQSSIRNLLNGDLPPPTSSVHAPHGLEMHDAGAHPHSNPNHEGLHVLPPRHNLIQRHELAEQYAPEASSGGMHTSPAPSSRRPSPPARSVSSEKVQKLVLTDDDKRRRNTAASARFRIKKKEREREMERTHKEMAKRIEDMELKIRQLETENEWLKKLALERNEARTVDTLDALRQQLHGAKTKN